MKTLATAIAIPLVCLLATAAPKRRLTTQLSVFDNGTGRGKLALDEQAELAKREGYAGIGYTGTKDIPAMLQALDSRGLKMTSIYTGVNFHDPKPGLDPGLPEAIRQLKGRDTLILFTLNGTPPDGDVSAVHMVREVAGMAAAAHLRVALYPHFGMYVARVEDALRVAKKVHRKNVGVVFNLCHWLRAGDEANMSARLRQAMPHLFYVSINGADHEGGWDRLIQPLDRGSFDVFGFLETLDRLGYRGPIGLQCYNVPGDTETNLTRSMRAWRAFSARLDQIRKPASSR